MVLEKETGRPSEGHPVDRRCSGNLHGQPALMPEPFYPTPSTLSNFTLDPAGPDNRQQPSDGSGRELGRRALRRGCETPRAWRGAGLAPWTVWATPSGQRRLV